MGTLRMAKAMIKPPAKRRRTSYLEEQLALWIAREGLPEPIRQFKFHPSRRWTFDFAYPRVGVALEVEGAIYVSGRHNRGSGFAKDVEKYNAAADLGWFVYRVTSQQFRDGSVFPLVKRIATARPTLQTDGTSETIA